MFELYFPENKLEYIPSVIQLIIFVIVAFLVMRLIRKISAKEVEKGKRIEEQMKSFMENDNNPEDKR